MTDSSRTVFTGRHVPLTGYHYARPSPKHHHLRPGVLFLAHSHGLSRPHAKHSEDYRDYTETNSAGDFPRDCTERPFGTRHPEEQTLLRVSSLCCALFCALGCLSHWLLVLCTRVCVSSDGRRVDTGTSLYTRSTCRNATM